jgi:hypothetical protein
MECEEDTMKLTMAVLASLLLATGVAAQSRGAFYGPFTGYEAQTLSEVWPQIREAAAWEDIDWRALGLRRAPGSPEAQQVMAANWSELRREARFSDIEWGGQFSDRGVRTGRYNGVDNRGLRTGRYDSAGRFEQQFPGPYVAGPFTQEEASIMSRVWGEIREAASFEDIDWRAYGLSGAPGSRDARRFMSRNWGSLREAAQFEDIDWRAAGFRVSSTYRSRG